MDTQEQKTNQSKSYGKKSTTGEQLDGGKQMKTEKREENK